MPRRGKNTPAPEDPAIQTILQLPDWNQDIPIAGDEQGRIYWPVRALCNWLGIDISGQLRILQSRAKMLRHMRYYRLKTPTRGMQAMWTIDEKMIGLWFGMIDDESVREELADRLSQFQDEVAEYAHFRLFGATSIPSLDLEHLSQAEILSLLKRLLADSGMVQLAWRNMELRLGRVEGKVELLSAGSEEGAEEHD